MSRAANEEFVRRAEDLAQGHRCSLAVPYARNEWLIIGYISMRAALRYLDKDSFLLRYAPRGEYSVTTKQLKEMLKKERGMRNHISKKVSDSRGSKSKRHR